MERLDGLITTGGKVSTRERAALLYEGIDDRQYSSKELEALYRQKTGMTLAEGARRVVVSPSSGKKVGTLQNLVDSIEDPRDKYALSESIREENFQGYAGVFARLFNLGPKSGYINVEQYRKLRRR